MELDALDYENIATSLANTIETLTIEANYYSMMGMDDAHDTQVEYIGKLQETLDKITSL
jgi:hypothetical protein